MKILSKSLLTLYIIMCTITGLAAREGTTKKQDEARAASGKTSLSSAIWRSGKKIYQKKSVYTSFLKSYPGNAYVRVSPLWGINLGASNRYLPSGPGVALSYRQNPAFFFKKESSRKKLKQWVPDILAEIGYQKYKSLPYSIDAVSISAGPLWALNFSKKMAGNLRISTLIGYAWLNLTASQYSFQIVNRVSNTFVYQFRLGYEFMLDPLLIVFDAGFGFIYDNEMPIYQLGFFLGIGYRLF